jgi:hypothetical protein
VEEVLRREITDAVLHLYGWFDKPASIVLGSYAKVTNNLQNGHFSGISLFLAAFLFEPDQNAAGMSRLAFPKWTQKVLESPPAVGRATVNAAGHDPRCRLGGRSQSYLDVSNPSYDWI